MVLFPHRSPVFVWVFVLLVGCSQRREPTTTEEPPILPTPQQLQRPVERVRNTGDLEPGDQWAFGLLLPQGAFPRLNNSYSKYYTIHASSAQVLRYLQRRLDITVADIHPLGAMIRNARVRTAPGATPTNVDVSVRDEGDRTMIIVWNRTRGDPGVRQFDSTVRGIGVDPRTGRPLNNN